MRVQLELSLASLSLASFSRQPCHALAASDSEEALFCLFPSLCFGRYLHSDSFGNGVWHGLAFGRLCMLGLT